MPYSRGAAFSSPKGIVRMLLLPSRNDVESLAQELEVCWQRTDSIFNTLRPEAFLAQPILQREPFLYYLGHLPAFSWNEVCRRGLDRGASSRPELDDLFSRRPESSVTGLGGGQGDSARWPRLQEVTQYRDEVRNAIRTALPGIEQSEHARALHVVIEHEALHQETLVQMAMHLAAKLKNPPSEQPAPSFRPGAHPREVPIPAGHALLGTTGDRIPFAWDHERPDKRVEVPAFYIDRTPVMNGEFLEFVRAGGYENPEFWSTSDWRWREASKLSHPTSWRKEGHDWSYRGLFEDLPLTRVFDWPVYVGWSEAQAYLSWQGKRLPTEAEFVRAAYAAPGEATRRYPWGDEAPESRHGNFNWNGWSAVPVGSHPDGASAYGVLELVGNGWEWTSSRVDSRGENCETLPEVPQDACVRMGASWATPVRQLRSSYRRWSQSHDPFVFGKFRGVRQG
jgi:gamma-glutamyl hercynylcysteine S-oxide synthase